LEGVSGLIHGEERGKLKKECEIKDLSSGRWKRR